MLFFSLLPFGCVSSLREREHERETSREEVLRFNPFSMPMPQVVCVLRSVLEEGRMLLADGRRVVPMGSTPRPGVLPIKEGFRAIVSAHIYI